jgi:hypothetical protein
MFLVRILYNFIYQNGLAHIGGYPSVPRFRIVITLYTLIRGLNPEDRGNA